MNKTIDLISRHARNNGLDVSRGMECFVDFLIDLFDEKNFGDAQRISELAINNQFLFESANRWLTMVSDEISEGRYLDFFGGVYEKLYKSSDKASFFGQFYTPSHICDMVGNLFKENGTIADNACGSGRMLLSHYSRNRKQSNYYYGSDIDIMSVKMCALNLMAHGMIGRVEWKNSLQDEKPNRVYHINRVRYPIPVNLYSIYESEERNNRQSN